MTKTTDSIAENTDIDSLSSIIDDTLRSLHISGSLLLRESYASPWAISIPDASSLGELLKVSGDSRVVAFHLVEFGHCTITAEHSDNIHIKAGEMVICFGGGSHQLIQGTPGEVQPVEKLLAGGTNIQRPNADASSEGAALLCGVFILQHTMLNPLYEGLPSLMHTRLSRSGELHNLSGVARLMTEEMDRESIVRSYIVERLLEVLCAEAIRAHIENVPRDKTNWLRGIKDPVIGRAIAAIHSQPGEDWTVQRMAEYVAMSPSRFAARFAASVGDSPMAYTTKWRMSLACRALIESKANIEQIASSIGYESSAAFSRTFKKHLGISPALWRTRQQI